MRRLAFLEPFFVHALTTPAASEATLVDSGEIGLIIANSAGKPIHFSAEGRRLLFLVTNPGNASGPTSRQPAVLPAPVAQLCQNLSQIFGHDSSACAPTYRHSNVWGGFTFRAQWLDEDHPASGLIGILVRHTVPLPIRLVQSVKGLPLSRRQAEVCVLMASGASNDKIAEQLGISKHTAIAHGRWIYNRLDVHSRAELVSRILSN
jgi:DNA-binding CsgD family transcriptional regulator